jgi:hypothetical protein
LAPRRSPIACARIVFPAPVSPVIAFSPDPGSHGFDHKLVIGFLALQFGMAGWSFGSIIQRAISGGVVSVFHSVSGAWGKTSQQV